MKSKVIKAGDNAINEGEEGDDFFMIEEGKLYAKRKETGDEKIMEYNDGDYFGELALVRSIPR